MIRRTLTDLCRGTGGSVILTVSEESDVKPRPVRRRFETTDADFAEAGSPTPGTLLFPEDYAILRRKSETAEAIEKAYAILSMSDNSVASLRQKLAARGYGKTSTDAAVLYMTERGYLDETAQIRRLIQRFTTEKPIGKRKLTALLAGKGYGASTIRNAIADAEADGTLDFAALRARCLSVLPRDTSPEAVRAYLCKNGF